MITYTLFWKDGSTNTAAGPDFDAAFYGGELSALAGYTGSDGSQWGQIPEVAK
jgi:hypothetical protein